MSSMFPSRETVARLREEYPAGTRVRLVKMDDPQAPPVGSCGLVEFVDDIGTVHVKWENGSGLGIAYGEDKCQIIGSEAEEVS